MDFSDSYEKDTKYNDKSKEDLLQNFFNLSIDMLCIAGTDGKFLKINNIWSETLGYTIDEILEMNFYDFIHEDDIEKTEKVVKQLLTGKNAENYVNRYRCKDGTYKYIEWRSTYKNNLILAVARDITDRVEEKATLKDFIKYSNELLSFTWSEINFNRLTDNILNLTEACLVVFNRFELKNKVAITKGISILNNEDASINYDKMIGQEWGYQNHQEKSRTLLTVYSNTNDVDQAVLNSSLKERLKQVTDFNKMYILSIKDSNEQLGQIILCAKSDIKNQNLLEIYGEKIALVLKLKNSEKLLLKSERKFRSYINEAPNGIFIINKNGYYEEVNKEATKLSGFSQEALINKHYTDIIREQGKKAAQEAFKEILSTGRAKIEVPIKTKTGENRFWYIEGIKLSEDKILVYAKDITKRILEKQELILSKKNAEAGNKAKSRFLASISHEIRTPLNGILGFMELFKNTTLDQEQYEYIKNVDVLSKLLLNHIENLLDLSKIEANKLKLAREVFSLEKTIQEAVFSLSGNAKEKGLGLNICTDEHLPKLVKGDEIKLKQIFINLIDNAIKFSQKGSVDIDVQLIKQSDKYCSLQVSVADEGMGMTAETINRIFRFFMQGDASHSRKYGGTGLGLPITKGIIEKMNGEIQVSSEVGVGTKFTFTLQLERVDSATEIEGLGNEKECNVSIAKDIKILLAEDDKYNAKYFIKLLQTLGLQCDVVENGKQAIEAVFKKDYDIVFMDCQMPSMDGYTATKEIRKSKLKSPYPKIIAVTAYTMEEDIQNCFDSGMDAYITKPFQLSDVIKIIKRFYPHRFTNTGFKKDITSYLENQLGLSQEMINELLYDYRTQMLNYVDSLEFSNENKEYIDSVLMKIKESSRNIHAYSIIGLIESCEGKMQDNMSIDCLDTLIQQLKSYIEKL
ncbi:PAS domain S-box protein [Serpentinicella sp. ANB-PHB4]|uniref:PAS domain S-box protein n=1 Tax=Serpentinicella sp. ANB-PHB4 TaxID=3074076 RepID=UPI002856BF64|nr:PAS domain S-box protein [Serpentinicella sp. ANB-PHB4]MDR5658480.1 PAS domain S-box protein [Serpentinicella sp. ANB-PHB4]